jgi:PIN domain nuclease of toxin-antitoxin system
VGSDAVKLLLDTHIWLWSLLDPDRLGRRTRAALAEPSTETWLSPITIWETLLLAEKGRVALEPDAERWVREQLARVPVREAPLNAEVAITSRRLVVSSDDPADRFLAATAVVYQLTLVTADRRLRRIKSVTVLPNS